MVTDYLLQITFLSFLFRKYTCETILTHKNELKFGNFRGWETCPTGSFVNAFEIKVDREEKNFSDEEGMTGIRLFCADENGDQTAIISSYSLPKGNWKGINSCPPQEWMNAFRIKIQKYSGWVRDDTGANNLEMVCNYTNIYNGRGNNRGDWTDWSKCPRGEVICGLQTKVEDSFTPDRSGLVAVHMRCCELSGENQTIYDSTAGNEVSDGGITVHFAVGTPNPTNNSDDEEGSNVQEPDIPTTTILPQNASTGITETNTNTSTSNPNTSTYNTNASTSELETTELYFNETLSTPSGSSEDAWETFPTDDGPPLISRFSSRLKRTHP